MFTFVGGNLALDLVGTVAERTGEPVEQLATTQDVGDWFVAAGVLDRPPKVTAAERARVVEVREAVHRLVAAHVASTRLPADDRRLVNLVAADTPPRVEVTATGEVRRTGDVGAGLAAVARSFVQLLGEPDTLVRWCEGDACTRPFVDRSRGHRRRWCGMAGCGDRAKAAAYRARLRG